MRGNGKPPNTSVAAPLVKRFARREELRGDPTSARNPSGSGGSNATPPRPKLLLLRRSVGIPIQGINLRVARSVVRRPVVADDAIERHQPISIGAVFRGIATLNTCKEELWSPIPIDPKAHLARRIRAAPKTPASLRPEKRCGTKSLAR